MTTTAPRISIGPLQFHWPRKGMLDFYGQLEDSPVDIVYLGETVCSKRREFRHQDWLDTAERLQAAGKEVVFSSLVLIEAQSEIGYLRRLCDSDTFRVEANDMSAVQLLAGKAPFVGGATLNITNERALSRLISLGLTRWVPPVEMTEAMYVDIRASIGAVIEYELPAWGRLPLAYSARCYTARAHRSNKDDCVNCCLLYPDGMGLQTRDGEDFLIINGIQTMSAKTFCRIGGGGDINAGDILRISPQASGTETVIQTFDAMRQDEIAAKDALAVLNEHAPLGLCGGYWHGQAGMEDLSINI